MTLDSLESYFYSSCLVVCLFFVCVHARAYMNCGWRPEVSSFSAFFLKTSSLKMEVPKLARLPLSSLHGSYRHVVPCLAFSVAAGDTNSYVYVCPAGSLTT